MAITYPAVSDEDLATYADGSLTTAACLQLIQSQKTILPTAPHDRTALSPAPLSSPHILPNVSQNGENDKINSSTDTDSDSSEPTTTPRPFTINHDILSDNVSPQTASALLRLPMEILALILAQIHIPYFQICFLLTCKRIGYVGSTNTSLLSAWRGYRDKEGLFRLLERHSKISPSWIPTRLRLCRACFIYLPTAADYWIPKMGSPAYDSRDLNWFDILNFFDGSTSIQHRCPQCCVDKNVTFISESLFARLADDDFLRGTGRCISPHLMRRIGQP